MSQAAPDLGPFRAPSTLEPEFHAPVPRPIPDELKRGAYEQKRRAAAVGLVLFGLSALAVFAVTRGTTLDLYFLALPWFDVVGLASIALGVVLAVVHRVRRGAYAYVRDGIPMSARVRSLRVEVARTQHGSPTAYRYLCEVEYQPPSGPLRRAVVPSPEFSATYKDSTETPLRVGDYVTAVALPGRVEKSLTLYGFLQLNPTVDFVRRRGRTAPMGALPLALLSVAGGYLLVGLLVGVVVVPSILPVAFPERVDPRWAVPVGIAVVALVGTVSVVLLKRSEDGKAKRIAAANARARREGRPIDVHVSPFASVATQVVVGLFCGAVALFVVASGVACLNALRDPGPPSYEAVAVQQLRQETWTGLFRSYAVRYVRDDGGSETIAVPVDRVADFQETKARQAALERRPGYLGLPWVKDIHPVLGGDDGVPMVGLPDGRRVPLAR